MDRLTKRISGNVYYTKGEYDETLPAECEIWDVREILKALAAYEDTGLTPERCAELAKEEREGRLMELPLKIGNTVYAYESIFNRVVPYKTEVVQIYADGYICYESNWTKDGELIDSLDFDNEDIGKTVFLTCEEAEEALESEV